MKHIQAFVEARRTLVGSVGAVGAAGLAVVWLLVVPDKSNDVAGMQLWAIRYGHSLCWVFVSAALASYAFRAPRHMTESMGWLALVAYAAFLLALFL